VSASSRRLLRALHGSEREPGGPPARVRGWLELESGGGRHHRRRSRGDGGDHLGGADPGQVRARRRHIPVSELTLQDWQRDTFAGEFNSVGMPKLMWREAAADTGIGGEAAELGTDRGA
jgi:hypothetical protein